MRPTGATTQAPFTTQSLTNMLSQLGISVPAGTNMQLKNVAAVMVTAELPPFAGTGQQLDVTVEVAAIEHGERFVCDSSWRKHKGRQKECWVLQSNGDVRYTRKTIPKTCD